MFVCVLFGWRVAGCKRVAWLVTSEKKTKQKQKGDKHHDVNAAVALFCFFSFQVISKVLLHRLTEWRGAALYSGVFHSSPSQVNRLQQENRTYHRVKQQAAAAVLHLYRGAGGGGWRGYILPRWLPRSTLLNGNASLPSSGSCVYLQR